MYRERQRCWLTLNRGRWMQRRFGRMQYRVVGEEWFQYLARWGVELERRDGSRFWMGWGEAMTMVPVWRRRRRRRRGRRER